MNLPPDENDRAELNEVIKRMLKSSAFSGAPMRKSLFKLLWENHEKPVRGRDIWVNLWPEEDVNKYGKPHNHVVPRVSAQRDPASAAVGKHEDPRENVRQQCSALSKVLDDYFNKDERGVWNTTSPWVIGLKQHGSGPKHGYELEWRRINDPNSLPRAFWRPHLDSGDPISLVYVEQRFFLDEPKGLVFRYYDCNDEQNSTARAELRQLHSEHHPNIDELIPLHPYVARGEVSARDLIVKWFQEWALENIKHAASRLISDKDETWEHSLILFGSVSSNRFVRNVLRRYPALPIQRSSRTQFTVKKLAQDPKETARIETAHLEGQCQVTMKETGCVLDFDPKQQMAPLLLTRVPNPDGTHPPVTIFDSERGRTIEQIAAVLTSHELMRQQMHRCGLEPPFPPAFQILCAISMRSHDRDIYPLVWRTLEGKVLIPNRPFSSSAQ
jgi:hypothetical protein